MKTMNLSRILPALLASLFLAAPSSLFAERKISVYRDNDGDGHFNKKKLDVSNRHYRNYDNRYYRSSGYYNRSSGFYNRSSGFYNRPFGYYHRPYDYYRPYSYYSGPAISLNFSRSSRSAYQSNYSDSLAVDVQRELRRRGYYRGSIDGDVGSGTRSAIRAYQDDRGLAVTGRIDRALIRALGVG